MKKSTMAILAFLLIFSCSKNYIRTDKVCDKKLFMEVYERNQLGICYLTDSINFNIYIGQLNFENEMYLYKCVSDTLSILKSSHDYGTGKDHIVDEHTYSIKELQKGKRLEK